MGGADGAPTVAGGILDPLKHQNQRKTPSTTAKGKKPRAKRTLFHARRASAVADTSGTRAQAHTNLTLEILEGFGRVLVGFS